MTDVSTVRRLSGLEGIVQVFVSYSRRDADFVERLDRGLSDFGYQVWVDTEDVARSAEDDWRRSIVAAIRQSKAVILVLSPHSTTSKNVERELRVAADIDTRLIPIVCQECVVPDGFVYELAGVQRIDFTKIDFTEGLRQLAARLGSSSVPPPVREVTHWWRSRAVAVTAIGAAALVSGTLIVATRDEPTPREHHHFSVLASDQCVSMDDSSAALDTQLSLVAGTEVTVEATGQWSSGESTPDHDRSSGPEGQQDELIGSLPIGALVGYLGTEPFEIGSGATFRAGNADDHLRLGFWDASGTCDDNFGVVQIDVIATTSSPE